MTLRKSNVVILMQIFIQNDCYRSKSEVNKDSMNITFEIKYDDDIEDIIEKAVICFEDGVKVLENILEEVKIVKLHSDLRILTQLQCGGCIIVWRVSGRCPLAVWRVS